MTNEQVIPLQSNADIEEQAAVWIAKLDGEDFDDEQTKQFNDWYAKSDRHAKIFDELAELYGKMDVLADLKDIAASGAVEAALTSDQSNAHRSLLWTIAGGAIAASFALSVGALMLLSPKPEPQQIKPLYQASVVTPRYEQKRLELIDGSSAVLNASTVAEIIYTEAARSVELTEGEGYFDVAPNPQAPFRVTTPYGSVQAIGTAFSVRVEAGRTIVMVTEGQVSARSLETATSDSDTLLSAGQSAEISRISVSDTVTDLSSIDQALDWRDGVLSFKGETLEAVIQKVSQYTDLEIVIVDEALRSKPIGGYFKIGETEALFEALVIMADVQVDRPSEQRVELVSATNSTP